AARTYSGSVIPSCWARAMPTLRTPSGGYLAAATACRASSAVRTWGTRTPSYPRSRARLTGTPSFPGTRTTAATKVSLRELATHARGLHPRAAGHLLHEDSALDGPRRAHLLDRDDHLQHGFPADHRTLVLHRRHRVTIGHAD